MKKFLGCALVVSAVLAPLGSAAEAVELTLAIANGKVTLIAHDVTDRQILDEWARVGRTQIVNGDKLLGAPVTLELRDVPEAAALDTVLRSAAGYMAAPRLVGSAGPSFYDPILILPTSRPPAMSAAPPPPAPFTRPTPPQPMPVVDDDGANEAGVAQPPAGGPQGQPFPGPTPATQQPGMQQPGMQQPGTQPGTQQPVMTLPRPGMLPPAPVGPGNPYQPGVRPPGAPGTPGGTAPTRPGGGGGGGSS